MDLYARALELKDHVTRHRRYLHKNAEAGLDLPKTTAYVKDTLQQYGMTPSLCGMGIMALIGNGNPVILLRADMDALPMKEDGGEDFASCTNASHTCGHDLHCAMLLCAAKILKESEGKLKGTVKLMFQPAEETLEGCRNMIDSGILHGPSVDAALAFHVGAGQMTPGKYMYNAGGVMMFSADSFSIFIKGKGGHGAYPDLVVDPIRIGVHIYASLESLIAKETPPAAKCTLTVGKFQGGEAGNIVPESAVLEGSLRTDSKEIEEKMKRRIVELSESIAKAFGGTAKVTFFSSVPPLICDEKLTQKFVSYMDELPVQWKDPVKNITAGASDDFSLLAERIPSAYMYLSAGFDDERGYHLAHNPKVRFNEDVCPIGVACLAHCATRWLEDETNNLTEANNNDIIT